MSFVPLFPTFSLSFCGDWLTEPLTRTSAYHLGMQRPSAHA